MKNETKHPFKGYVFSSGTTNPFDQETNYITLMKKLYKISNEIKDKSKLNEKIHSKAIDLNNEIMELEYQLDNFSCSFDPSYNYGKTNLFEQETNYKNLMKKIYKISYEIKTKSEPNRKLYKKAIELFNQLNELNYQLEKFADSYK